MNGPACQWETTRNLGNYQGRVHTYIMRRCHTLWPSLLPRTLDVVHNGYPTQRVHQELQRRVRFG